MMRTIRDLTRGRSRQQVASQPERRRQRVQHHRPRHTCSCDALPPPHGAGPTDPQPAGNASRTAAAVTRRQLAGLIAGGLGWSVAGLPGTSSTAAAAGATTLPAAPGAGCARLEPAAAAVFTRAVDEALSAMGVGPEEALQRERFKLFQQEYSYYYEANKDSLPRIPDVSDESGGLSNRTYFNFISYIGWKVAARRVAEVDRRSELCRRVGAALLADLMPGEADALKKEAARSPGGVASEAAMAAALGRLFDRLQSVGYTCGWQLTWGETPGGWPPDWYLKEPGLLGAPSDSTATTSSSSSSSGSSSSSSSSSKPGRTVFQVKLLQPADIRASVALRAEDDGFWARHASSMAAALMAAGGWRGEASEYFYQDDWTGPTTLGGRVLLLLGDPLEQVDVPWTPQTLVQDWTAAPVV